MTHLPRAVPDPGPQAPPGFADLAGNLLSWMKWGVLVAGVLGILFCAFMLIIGRRNRSATAFEGLVGSAWVLAGLARLNRRTVGGGVPDMSRTGLRLAAWTLQDHSTGPGSLGAAIHPERPAPVVATWDEDTGWCVGLHHDPTQSSRRYLHPDLLPAARLVADFVVGLALGQPLGATHPIASPHPAAHDSTSYRDGPVPRS